MPRYDKYEPYAGGFRGALAAAIPEADGFTAFGVGLDTDGHVVKGAGTTGILGVMIAHGAKRAGDIVDIMTGGEIVEFTANGTPTGGAADPGTVYYAATATGAISTTNTGKAVGVFTDDGRLVVRVAFGATVDSIGAS